MNSGVLKAFISLALFYRILSCVGQVRVTSVLCQERQESLMLPRAMEFSFWKETLPQSLGSSAPVTRLVAEKLLLSLRALGDVGS